MKRFRINTGSVFAATLGNGKKKFFQFVCLDITQLNSEVIRVFETEYSAEEVPDLESIVNGKVEFYAHVMIRYGAKLGLWEKVGNASAPDRVPVWFRGTPDYGRKLGEPPVQVSGKWWVWKVGEPRIFVGRITGEHRLAEIGLVVTPCEVLARMETGAYTFEYPAFE